MLLLILILSLNVLRIYSSSLFDFEVAKADGNMISLNDYKGKKAFLIVNVASYCGYTQGHYNEMKLLYDKYKDYGLEILAFPCNDFGQQEPDSNEQIQAFCNAKGAEYPVFGKLKCNANDNTVSSLYNWLMKEAGIERLQWNFNKFLLNEEGKVINYSPQSISVMQMENIIKETIGNLDL